MLLIADISGYTDHLDLIDREVKRIVDECYQAAVETLETNRHRLDALAHALPEEETLEADQGYRIVGLEQRPQVA